MKEASSIIYLALSSLLTITLRESGIRMNDGKFWLIMGCFLGGYLCGMASALGG